MRSRRTFDYSINSLELLDNFFKLAAEHIHLSVDCKIAAITSLFFVFRLVTPSRG
jgi:hypothetical protein